MDTPTPAPSIERREILEERGNRDAFRLALLIGAIAILMLVLAIVVAWHARFVVMGFPDIPPAAHKTFSQRIQSPAENGVSKKAAFEVTPERTSAPLGVAAPSILFRDV